MRKLIIILFAFLSISQVKAQLAIEYSAGYATYEMTDMNNFLSNIRDQINTSMPGLDAQIVTSFPDYVMHNLSVGYRFKNMEVGINSSYYTTGAKISKEDYSGEYSFKMYLNGFRQGLYYRNYFYTANINSSNKLYLYGEISPSLIFSSIKMKEKLIVNKEEDVRIDKKINTISFAILPQVGAQFNFNRQIGLFAKMGYELSVPNESTLFEKKTKLNWSGFRINGGIRLSL